MRRLLIIAIASFVATGLLGVALIAVLNGRDELAAGILTTIAASGAAFGAWRAVNLQLTKEERKRKQEDQDKIRQI